MLRASLEALQARLNNYEELASENSQLRADLRYVQSNFNFNLLGARVISQSSNPLVSSITIDKGEQNGVKINQAVIAPEGLVGKIIETSPFSSQVLLLTDPTNTVAVMIQQTRNVGVATGGVMGQLNLKFLSVDLELEKDQTVVTTGSEIYPAGIMVGKISKVTKSENMLFLNVKINPAVKLSKLARVFVVRR
jgi:rod shape-determining protein MreC